LPALSKYEVIEEIGHGGMAAVYRAHDPRLGRDVAVKVIHPHLRDSQEAKHRFYVEAKAVAKLRHPNIVEVFDVSSEGEAEQYLVVELVRGSTLRKLLQQRGVIPPEVAAALAVEILAALAHAHAAGVVHRDVKPENVMVEHERLPPSQPVSAVDSEEPPASPETTSQRPPAAVRKGERVRVKLTDFGIAKLLDAQGVTSTGQVLGSPAHMAPEQIEGGEVDGRSDVFGLGVLLYECMVGHLPFEGNNPAQVLRRVLEGIYPTAESEQPKVGRRWSLLLDRALRREPAERFEDAASMQAALLAELSALGIDSPRAELEAWFDDPQAYTLAREAPLIAKLCALGRAARDRGDAVQGAAHFNRALAYAPHDPALLKIVSTIHRARARRELTLRIVPLVLASAALGTAAFYVARAVRHRAAETVDIVSPPLAASSIPPVPPPPTPQAVAPSASASAPRAVPPAPLPPIARSAPKLVERAITLSTLRPPFGVLFAIDGAAAGEAHAGLLITLDSKAHNLSFTCMNDECEPLVKTIAAGEEPVTLPIALRTKPATLIVDGDPSQTYGIVEFPSIALRVGVPTPIHVEYGNYEVHVVERPSGRLATTNPKLNPGKEVHATFPKVTSFGQ
jgi:serine/threonine-protein kinase